MTLVSGVCVSASPPAKKTTGLIEKETEVSYDIYGIRLRAQDGCMRFNLILFVLVLVLVLGLVLEKSKFVKKLLDTASRTRTSTTTRTTTKSVLCNRVRNFTKMTLDIMKFHICKIALRLQEKTF
jgi:hypothetical protein